MQNVSRRRAMSPVRQGFGIGACAIVVLTAAAVSNTARAEMFLKLSGIDGESVSERHKDEVEVTGIILPILGSAPTLGGGSGKGKVACPSLTVFKNLDKASPVLMKKLAQGVHIPQAVLSVQRSAGEPVDYYTLTMDEVYVSEVTQASEDTGRLSDKVVFTARRYTFEYRVQNPRGDSPSVVKFGWDCVTTQIT